MQAEETPVLVVAHARGVGHQKIEGLRGSC